MNASFTTNQNFNRLFSSFLRVLTIVVMALPPILPRDGVVSTFTGLNDCGTVELQYWNPFTGPDGQFMGEMVDAFNGEHPDIQVTMTILDDYYTRLAAAAANDTLPDVAIVHAEQVATQADRDILRLIDELILEMGITSDDYPVAVWQAGEYAGQHYSIPLDIHPLAMYYNADLLHAAGFDSPPATREEFEAFAAAVTTGETHGFDVTSGFPARQIFQQLLHQFGGTEFNGEVTEAAWNSEAGVQALQWLKEAQRKYSTPNLQVDEELNEFKNGTVGMIWNGIWQITALTSSGVGFDSRASSVPQIGPAMAVAAGSHQFALPVHSTADACKDAAAVIFMKYILDRSVTWAKSGQIPASNSARQSAEFLALEPQASIARSVEYAFLPPPVPGITDALSPLNEAIMGVMSGSLTDVQGALDDAVRRANEILAGKQPPPHPFIAVSLTVNWIILTDFLPDAPATVSVYEDQESDTPVAELTRNTDAFGNLYIDGLEINWDLETGNFVVATDGATTKELLLEYLTLDVFDPANDVVSGHALPGHKVDVGAGNAGGEQWMTVFADHVNGVWTADYTTIGFDITEDMWAGGHVNDEDGDVTAAHNSGPPEPPDPHFTIFPEWEWFDGLDWPDGATVNITVQEKPECTTTSESWDHFFNGGFPGGCDIAIGDTVTFTDGTTTRSHTVRNLVIKDVNQEDDTIRGTAEAGSEVYVWPHATGEQQMTTADADGNWQVNLTGIFDIRAGEYGRSEIRDEFGNSTAVDWGIPMPWLIAFPENDAVEGWEWPEGATVTLTIVQAPGLAWQGTSAVTTWGDPRTYVLFEFANDYDLKAGDVVTLTDGLTVREHVVQNLSVTNVDENTESVTGSADAGAEVQVWPHGFDPDYTIQAVAGDGGTWIADFASLGFDLTKGTGGRSQIVIDGNSTAVDWQVPIPHDIYIFDAQTKQTRQVTNSPNTHEYNPRWSPDGKKIVHDTWSIDWSSHGIYITDVATGLSKSLTGAEGGSYPTWSPSGKWIAFDRGADGDNRLFILSPNGGVPRLVTEDAFMPAWSPNSQRLAYHQPSDGSIRTVDVNGGSKTLVAAYGNGPAWSPDGEWIAFEREGDVWKVQVNNSGSPLGEPIQLTSSPLWEGRPTWSNNSKTIAYHAGMGQDTDIWTIPSAGGTATWLTGAPIYGDYDPNYSFNGNYIAYSSFSPDGQAARLWVAEYTYDLPAGSWSAGPHTYRYEWNWSEPEPGTVIGGNREFIVSGDSPAYDGYVLLSLAGRRRGIHTENGLVCEGVEAINPDQPTRFIAGWLTDYEMTHEEALAQFDSMTIRAVWDDGQSVDLGRHEILPWSSVDWAQYSCSFTEP